MVIDFNRLKIYLFRYNPSSGRLINSISGFISFLNVSMSSFIIIARDDQGATSISGLVGDRRGATTSVVQGN